MVKTEATDTRFYVHQEDETLNQVNPISGTVYPVPNIVDVINARIVSIRFQCTWTVQPNPLQIYITRDGIVDTIQINNPNSAANYIAFNHPAGAGILAILFVNDAAEYATGRTFLFESKLVTIEAEITGGTVQNLTCHVKYDQYL